MRPLRRDLQVIFQDPFSSLNPRKTVGARSLPRHCCCTAWRAAGSDLADHAATALKQVGSRPKLRVGAIRRSFQADSASASALRGPIALKPRFVLADEIVSGLDMSSQAQILDLLMDAR